MIKRGLVLKGLVRKGLVIRGLIDSDVSGPSVRIKDLTVGGPFCTYTGAGTCTASGDYQAEASGLEWIPTTWTWSVVSGIATVVAGGGTDTVTIETALSNSDETFEMKVVLTDGGSESVEVTKTFRHDHRVVLSAVSIVETAPGSCTYDPDIDETECTTNSSYTGTYTGSPSSFMWSSDNPEAVIVSGQGTDSCVVQSTSGINVPFKLSFDITSRHQSDQLSESYNHIHYDGTGPIQSIKLFDSAKADIILEGNGNITATSAICGWTVSVNAGAYVAPDSASITGNLLTFVMANPLICSDFYKLDYDDTSCDMAVGGIPLSSNTDIPGQNLVNTPQPVVTVDPVSASVGEPDTHLFSITATDTDSYQWKLNGSDISGATGSSYTTDPTAVANSPANYTCDAINGCGVDTSAVAVLTINPVFPVISVQPQNQTVNEPKAATFTIVAAPATGYQWKLNGSNIAGATNSSYTTDATVEGQTGNYTCVVINYSASIESNIATITVDEILLEAVLEFNALDYDPDTFEFMGINQGVGDLTVVRAGDLHGRDYQGVWRRFTDDEKVVDGGRVVRNLLRDVDDATKWPVISATMLGGQSDPFGGTKAGRLTATANNGRTEPNALPYGTPEIPGVLTTYLASVWIRRVTGTGDIQLLGSTNSSCGTVNASTSNGIVPVTSTWQRFSTIANAVKTTNLAYNKLQVRCAVSGDEVDVAFPQLELLDERFSLASPINSFPEGEMDDATGWTLPAGATISGGKMSFASVGGSASIRFPIQNDASKLYLMEMYVSAYTEGQLLWHLDADNGGSYAGPISGFQGNITPVAGQLYSTVVRGGHWFNIRTQGATTTTLDIDFVRLREIGSAAPSEYVESVGLIAKSKIFANALGNTIPNDVTNTVVTEAPGALLPELPYLRYQPQAENVCLSSRDLTQPEWTLIGGTTVTYDQVGIDGVPNSASKLTATAANSFVGQSISAITSNGINTVKAWAFKNQSTDTLYQIYYEGDAAKRISYHLDTVTGIATVADDNTDDGAVEVIDDGDSWIICMSGSDKWASTNALLYVHSSLSSQNSFFGNIEFHSGKGIPEVRGLSCIFTDATSKVTNRTVMSYDLANHDDTNGALYCEFDFLGEDLGAGTVFNAWQLLNASYNSPMAKSGTRWMSYDGTNQSEVIQSASNSTFGRGASVYHAGEALKMVSVLYDGQSKIDSPDGPYDGAFSVNLSAIFIGMASVLNINPFLIRKLQRYSADDYQKLKDKIDELMIEVLTDSSGNVLTDNDGEPLGAAK